MDEIFSLLKSLGEIGEMLKEKRPRSKCCKAVTYTAGIEGVRYVVCSDCGAKTKQLTEA